MKFLLKGDICYSESKDKLIIKENAFAACENGLCRGVFDSAPDGFSDAEILDFSGHLIIPGMVDLHTHAPQFAFRGMGMDLELLEWLNAYAFKEEAKYQDLSYAEKAYSLFSDAMKRSATTRAAIFATLHEDATLLLMEKLEESGIISYVGKVNMDRNSPSWYIESSADASAESTKRWIAQAQSRFSRTFPILTPRFTPSCTDNLMEKLVAIQEQFQLPVQSHLSENLDEIKWVKELCPETSCYGDAYDRFSLFGSKSKTLMAHCVYSTDEEIALMKKNGVFAVHCPASNMNVASGIAPIRRYLEEGLNLGLGTDVAGGQSESMFRAVSDAIQNSKLYYRCIDNQKQPLSFEEAFFLSTRGGGAFFGKVGAFEKDFEFDALVLEDAAIPHPQPLSVRQRLERAVYLGADQHCARAKFCRGRRVF